MNKISIFFLVIGYIICQNPVYLRTTIDTLSTEPYHHFDWLDEDDYTITITYDSTSEKPTQCCLWNGTHFCKGECPPNDPLSCKFTGASCGADGDNPATKYYYALYCHATYCDSLDNIKAATGLSAYSVDVTVAVSRESYIRYSMVLLLSLLVL